MMNVLLPVSEFMAKDLITVGEGDGLNEVKKIFDDHNIHHIPVVHFKEIKGMISKTDFLAYQKGVGKEADLAKIDAKQVMTTKLAKLSPDDRIQIAIDLFTLNRFHALPVVDKGELVGLITTHDLIIALSKEKIHLEDYKH
ncbi:MAG: CBS domain-containing protein [Lewinellaceae bacterium]|nr:CBS domain-containing protein [Lewinellaceae bacterium]